MNQPSRLFFSVVALWPLAGCPGREPPREVSLQVPETITSRDPILIQAHATSMDGTRESLTGDLAFELTPKELATLGPRGSLTCNRSGEGSVRLSVAGVGGSAKISCKLAAKLELPARLRIDAAAGSVDPKVRVLDGAGKELDLPVSLTSDRGSVVQARGGVLTPMAVGVAKITVRAGQVVGSVDVEVVRTLKPELVPVDQNRRFHYSLEPGKYRLELLLPSAHDVSVVWLGAPYCSYKGSGKSHVSNCTLQTKGGVSFDNPAFLASGQKTTSLDGVALLEVP